MTLWRHHSLPAIMSGDDLLGGSRPELSTAADDPGLAAATMGSHPASLASRAKLMQEAAEMAEDGVDPFESRRRAMGLESSRIADREDDVSLQLSRLSAQLAPAPCILRFRTAISCGLAI